MTGYNIVYDLNLQTKEQQLVNEEQWYTRN